MSILTTYHDCDRVAIVVGMAILWLLAMIAAHFIDKRREFALYEQRRLEYSRKRMENIRNLSE